MVVSDLYLGETAPQDVRESRWPALAHLARFSAVRALPQGWRSWLAHWLGSYGMAAASPAAVAATVCDALRLESSRPTWVWLADPVELSAGLTSVHLTALLRLDAAEQAELCRDFNALFGPTGYHLAPTRAGRFLAAGPPASGDESSDPARWLGASLGDGLARQRADVSFRRLGAEIEMWLHGHPLNARRMREQRAPVSTLWLWGGGAALAQRESEPAVPSARVAGRRAPLEFFGDDAFVEGLAHLTGTQWAPAARGLDSIVPSAERTVIQVELFGTEPERERLRGQPSPAASLAEILERDWVAPALERLGRGDIERLIVVAGDRQALLTRRDGWKRWRRRRAALAAFAAP